KSRDLHLPSVRAVVALALFGAVACSSTRPSATSNNVSPSELQLFLLAGQSNMAGRGVVEPQDRVANPRVVMLDRTLHWVPATDPVHYDKPIAGVGPGRTFALTLVARDPNLRVGLIPAAVGGSPISSWEPGALDPATKTHPYDDAIARARVAMRDGRLRAILWHQGESDAHPGLSERYDERLRALIARFRTDLNAPDLPFIIGELGQFPGKPWDADVRRVDSVHRAIAATVPHVAYVSSDGLRDKGDTLHFNAASQRVFGERYARAYLALVNARRTTAP
ncbi:MAG TPA: sialate O-acetylesterase, partial [Gemmatimonadaceae bacterium]